jgi:hypothetical protein
MDIAELAFLPALFPLLTVVCRRGHGRHKKFEAAAANCIRSPAAICRHLSNRKSINGQLFGHNLFGNEHETENRTAIAPAAPCEGFESPITSDAASKQHR